MVPQADDTLAGLRELLDPPMTSPSDGSKHRDHPTQDALGVSSSCG